jgi:hypothetical protein
MTVMKPLLELLRAFTYIAFQSTIYQARRQLSSLETSLWEGMVGQELSGEGQGGGRGGWGEVLRVGRRSSNYLWNAEEIVFLFGPNPRRGGGGGALPDSRTLRTLDNRAPPPPVHLTGAITQPPPLHIHI